MIQLEKKTKINAILQDQHLDALLLGDPYNIQYATGVRIPVALAQPDLVMFALFSAQQEPVVLLPDCWHEVARQESYFANLMVYRPDKPPLDAAIELIMTLCHAAHRVGIDAESISVAHTAALEKALSPLGIVQVACDAQMRQARAVKTAAERDLLTRIAAKTDHVINGHFHHLSADRPRTASLISESLRVHSSERDIEIAGYNACARAVLGESIRSFWAYAPKYGFAEAEMTQEFDAIIADVQTSEGGYWSNATRIAISSDVMSEEQAAAYEALNLLRNMLLEAVQIGRTGAEIYAEVVAAAQAKEIDLVTNLGLGFGVGVSPLEGPFLAPGEIVSIEAGMVLVLDPVVKLGNKFYRSRDTVVIADDGAQIVNWYKDWREPYLAILEL